MSIDQDQNPSIDRSGSTDIVLRGSWRVESLAASVNLDQIRSTVWLLAEKDDMAWDLTQLSGLDYIGAQLLWDGWKRSSVITGKKGRIVDYEYFRVKICGKVL